MSQSHGRFVSSSDPEFSPLCFAAQSVGPSRRPASRRPTVLVIDDERPIREVTALFLQNDGMRVYTAPDGYAGLALFERRADEIDLALVDYKLPGLDGPAVCERMLQIKPQTKILISSGYRTFKDIESRLGDAVRGFVQKPYVAGTLIGRVRAALPSAE